MNVRWTKFATRDLAAIVRYIREDSRESAQRVKNRISHEVMGLDSMPLRGREGIVQGTREIVIMPWPYIVVYKVINDEVRILRVRHGKQQWPR